MHLILIMRIYALCMSIYSLFRIEYVLNYCKVPFAIALGLSVVLSGVIYYLCCNMWKHKGLYSLSAMLSLIITDVISCVVNMFIHATDESIIFKLWLFGGFAVLFFIILFAYGYINETKVYENRISLSSDKLRNKYTFVGMSDIHYGTIQDKETLKKKINDINAINPDFVLIAGDVAEEHTSNEDMKELFLVLSKLKTKYGTFFVHGNHDRQEKLSKDNRTYTDEEFNQAMKEANIVCLDDTSLSIGDDLLIVGRDDLGVKERAKVSDLIHKEDKDRYIIVFEHRPEDCKSSEKEGVSLQFSGHYHGAQNWPNNIMYKLSGIYYNGMYNIGRMKLFVSSGFTGSQYPYRTHGKCEYVVFDLDNK